jgi:hypothetical protein
LENSKSEILPPSYILITGFREVRTFIPLPSISIRVSWLTPLFFLHNVKKQLERGERKGEEEEEEEALNRYMKLICTIISREVNTTS